MFPNRFCGLRVCDLGCGTGLASVGAFLAGAQSVLALDRNLTPLRRTLDANSEILAQHGDPKLAKLQVGDQCPKPITRDLVQDLMGIAHQESTRVTQIHGIQARDFDWNNQWEAQGFEVEGSRT